MRNSVAVVLLLIFSASLAGAFEFIEKDAYLQLASYQVYQTSLSEAFATLQMLHKEKNLPKRAEDLLKGATINLQGSLFGLGSFIEDYAKKPLEITEFHRYLLKLGAPIHKEEFATIRREYYQIFEFHSDNERRLVDLALDTYIKFGNPFSIELK